MHKGNPELVVRVVRRRRFRLLARYLDRSRKHRHTVTPRKSIEDLVILQIWVHLVVEVLHVVVHPVAGLPDHIVAKLLRHTLRHGH